MNHRARETEPSVSFADHVDHACRQILATYDVDRSPVSKEIIASVLCAFAEGGLLGLGFMKSGVGHIAPADVRKATDVMARLAACSGSLASVYMVNAVLGPACVALLGTRAQQEAVLAKSARGAIQLAFALTEPDAGSDAAGLATAATFDGDDVVLHGEKIYITGAATADVILVAAKPSGSGAKREVGLFLVPGDAPGLSIEPLDKLAGNVHASCRVSLEGVRIPANRTLGGREKAGGAWGSLRALGALERLLVAALAVGLAEAVVDRAVAFALSRRQFGQPIASFQAIQHLLVEMQTARTGMRLFVDHAVSALERGEDATQEICMAKYTCSETLQAIVAKGMRVVGGRGYFAFEEMERFYREAPFSLYAGGTIEIQKMLIARTMKLA